jgi:hypothetical protein
VNTHTCPMSDEQTYTQTQLPALLGCRCLRTSGTGTSFNVGFFRFTLLRMVFVRCVCSAGRGGGCEAPGKGRQFQSAWLTEKARPTTPPRKRSAQRHRALERVREAVRRSRRPTAVALSSGALVDTPAPVGIARTDSRRWGHCRWLALGLVAALVESTSAVVCVRVVCSSVVSAAHVDAKEARSGGTSTGWRVWPSAEVPSLRGGGSLLLARSNATQSRACG